MVDGRAARRCSWAGGGCRRYGGGRRWGGCRAGAGALLLLLLHLGQLAQDETTEHVAHQAEVGVDVDVGVTLLPKIVKRHERGVEECIPEIKTCSASSKCQEGEPCVKRVCLTRRSTRRKCRLKSERQRSDTMTHLEGMELLNTLLAFLGGNLAENLDKLLMLRALLLSDGCGTASSACGQAVVRLCGSRQRRACSRRRGVSGGALAPRQMTQHRAGARGAALRGVMQVGMARLVDLAD